MHRIARPLSLLALTLVVGACEASYFAASVEASEICVIDMPLSFPAVPDVVAGEMGAVVTTLETNVGEDELGIVLSDELELNLGVLSVAMVPASGVTDLAFVNELAIDIGAMESELPSIRVVELAPDGGMVDGGLYGEPDEAVDITAYIREGELVMDFALEGSLPGAAWETHIDLCLEAGAGYVAPLE